MLVNVMVYTFIWLKLVCGLQCKCEMSDHLMMSYLCHSILQTLLLSLVILVVV